MSFRQTRVGGACLLFACLYWCSLLALSCADTTMVQLPFSGGSPICPASDCPQGMNCLKSFECDTSPTWQNGTTNFIDPMGPGSVINIITVTVAGTFGCDQANVPETPMIHVYFAGAKLGEIQVITSTNCSCRNCARLWPYTLYVDNGWPSYLFGETNTVQVYASSLTTCLNAIDVLLDFTPGNTSYTTSTSSISTTSGDLTSSTGTTTNGTTPPKNQHDLVVVGAVMLSGMVFVNMCVVGGWYALKKKPESEDAESGNGSGPSVGPLLDKQLHYKDIQMGERIGRGSFGEVYSAIWFSTHVAVKKLPLEMLRQNINVLDEFSREIKLLKSLRHPNILQFLGSCSVPPNICLVTEFLPRGDLHKIIHDKTIKLEKSLMKSILIDVSRGMTYLHSSNPVVIHRDLKSHNGKPLPFWQFLFIVLILSFFGPSFDRGTLERKGGRFRSL
eukprot:Phypoly_transcript_05912.p1 GENE.Phypoly_transcript_05912~~Phypoly_transcript_05912.p1  ORF type:complete len:446 (+),score=31.19 Phypoly_transcript_05912:139-1476(+)